MSDTPLKKPRIKTTKQVETPTELPRVYELSIAEGILDSFLREHTWGPEYPGDKEGIKLHTDTRRTLLGLDPKELSEILDETTALIDIRNHAGHTLRKSLTMLLEDRNAWVIMEGASVVRKIIEKAGVNHEYGGNAMRELRHCQERGLLPDLEHLQLIGEIALQSNEPKTVERVLSACVYHLEGSDMDIIKQVRDAAKEVGNDTRLISMFGDVLAGFPLPIELKPISFSAEARVLEGDISDLNEFFQGDWFKTRFGASSNLSYTIDLNRSLRPVQAVGGPPSRDWKIISKYTQRVEKDFWNPLDGCIKKLGDKSPEGFSLFFRQLKQIFYEYGDSAVGYWTKDEIEATLSNARALKLLDDTTDALKSRGVRNAEVFRERVSELITDYFSSVGYGHGFLMPGYCYGPKTKDSHETGPYDILYRTSVVRGMYLDLYPVSMDELPYRDYRLLNEHGDLIRHNSPQLAVFRRFGLTKKTMTPRDYKLEPDLEAFGTVYDLLTPNRALTDTDVLWDFGCGPAHYMLYLKGKGFNGKILGIDSSLEMGESARAAGFDAVQADITRELPSGRFTHGVCLDVLQGYSQQEIFNFLRLVSGAMTNDSLLVIGVIFGPEENRPKREGEIISLIDDAERRQWIEIIETREDKERTYVTVKKGRGA